MKIIIDRLNLFLRAQQAKLKYLKRQLTIEGRITSGCSKAHARKRIPEVELLITQIKVAIAVLKALSAGEPTKNK